MPANLTPQYSKAEEAYRKAQTPQERVECLEQMLQLIPKHKGTEKLQADLKTRLKEAREESQEEKQAAKPGKSYRIPRQGAGTVVVIGGPNAGKSRVLAELTNAHPEVAPYPFTTREPQPGMMPWEDATVQLIDTPPITDHHIEPYLTGFVRGADLVLLCLDGSSDDAPEQTAAVYEQLRSRKTLLDARSGFDEEDYAIVHVRTFLVVTRGDDPDVSTRLELFRELVATPLETHVVSLDRPESVAALRDAIYPANRPNTTPPTRSRAAERWTTSRPKSTATSRPASSSPKSGGRAPTTDRPLGASTCWRTATWWSCTRDET
jgi:predicted GTPase